MYRKSEARAAPGITRNQASVTVLVPRAKPAQDRPSPVIQLTVLIVPLVVLDVVQMLVVKNSDLIQQIVVDRLKPVRFR